MAYEYTHVRWLEQLGADDAPMVGGKNASLGEMIRALTEEGIRVPDGFATTAAAYWEFLQANDLEKQIQAHLEQWERGTASLETVAQSIRRLFRKAEFPQDIAAAIRQAYRDLGERYRTATLDVAVRSSATAEDLPEASFAGQQDTFLNIRGEQGLLEACRKCYASLFTARAISYGQETGFEHMNVAQSVGVQKMVPFWSRR